MKTQIDDVVRNILTNLARRTPPDSQLAQLHIMLGIDGLSVAIALRDQLCRWAGDMTLPEEARSYAAEKLATLPTLQPSSQPGSAP